MDSLVFLNKYIWQKIKHIPIIAYLCGVKVGTIKREELLN